MASTYSNLKFQLMATGENLTTWGVITNVNLGTAVEEAISGTADVTFSSGNVTLTLTDTNATQTARNLRLNCTGTTGGARNLIVPAIEKVYIVNNGCADAITVKNATGTGIAVPAGKTMWVFNDGTNVLDVATAFSSIYSAGTLNVAGHVTLEGVTSTGATGTGKLVFDTSPTLVTPLLGTPTSGNLANCTALPISTGVSGLGTGVATFLGTPSSANLAAALTDELGSGSALFGSDVTFTPTDQSGGGVPLTVARAAATKVGTRYFVDMAFSYGITGDGSLCVIGLGSLPNCANVSGVGGNFLIYFGGAAFLQGFLIPNTNTFGIYDSAGSQQHNVGLSGATIRCQFQYPTV